MDLWDRDAIDLLGPAFIEIGADGTGSFRFVVIVVVATDPSRRRLRLPGGRPAVARIARRPPKPPTVLNRPSSADGATRPRLTGRSVGGRLA